MSKLHFVLTEKQANALLEVVYGIECLGVRVPAKHPAITAADAIDEQMAQQVRQWERCESCGGSGWVES